ncbi:hypothetical protein HS1genome_1938 [Sulfodiicoccus acidiphilus]|uniref:Uncharacterized protein n=1 Tax=Sulfodiicoccus acidiphilus TaxID=1670455 RepID=A0A348B5U7_9CREN|nr:hypothetical protein [Sulfodiicoccus acidiphilus]BBD73549.1 hypothetical protein HS1genome_1938 [Sulfodiicoccus acidiphilus]GGT92356.1 hypothetical protein GCM10007116_07600 [Sulfodiicoccus acidiphilus]
MTECGEVYRRAAKALVERNLGVLRSAVREMEECSTTSFRALSDALNSCTKNEVSCERKLGVGAVQLSEEKGLLPSEVCSLLAAAEQLLSSSDMEYDGWLMAARNKSVILGCERDPLMNCVGDRVAVPALVVDWREFARSLKERGGTECQDTVNFQEFSVVKGDRLRGRDYMKTSSNVIVELDIAGRDNVARDGELRSGLSKLRFERVMLLLKNWGDFTYAPELLGYYTDPEGALRKYLSSRWPLLWRTIRGKRVSRLELDEVIRELEGEE